MIQLKNINKYYDAGDEKLHVLKDINFQVEKGDFVAIMGPSGSGKTTLSNLIGFLDRKFTGEYLFEGEAFVGIKDSEMSKIRNESVGFVFQNFSLIENNTIFENVALPLRYSGLRGKQVEERVLSALDKVGIKDKSKKLPKQISGGQQQRAAIARALINNPHFVIADEPTGALDTETAEEIMKLFQEINQKDETTIILITHNPETIKYCNRLVKVRDGAIIHDSEVN